jgi:FPC/CPF motif-containing protein YcgG
MLISSTELIQQVGSILADDPVHLLLHIVSSSFPCFFATQAAESGDLYFCKVRHQCDDAIVGGAREFVEILRNSKTSRKTALLIHFKVGDEFGHAEAEAAFWAVLQRMLDADSEGWPSERSADPDASDFMFSYEGAAFYPFCMYPGSIHRSRRSASLLAVVMVPQQSFAGIERGSALGDKARAQIRNRLVAFDGHPQDAAFDPAVPIWRTYFLSPEYSPAKTCPLKARSLNVRGARFCIPKDWHVL